MRMCMYHPPKKRKKEENWTFLIQDNFLTQNNRIRSEITCGKSAPHTGHGDPGQPVPGCDRKGTELSIRPATAWCLGQLHKWLQREKHYVSLYIHTMKYREDREEKNCFLVRKTVSPQVLPEAVSCGTPWGKTWRDQNRGTDTGLQRTWNMKVFIESRKIKQKGKVCSVLSPDTADKNSTVTLKTVCVCVCVFVNKCRCFLSFWDRVSLSCPGSLKHLSSRDPPASACRGAGILRWWIRVKPIECTTLRVSPNVNYGLWVIMTCQEGLTIIINLITATGDVAESGGGWAPHPAYKQFSF